MISASRGGDSLRGSRRLEISSFQSGTFDLRDAVDSLDKSLPAAALRGENSPALASEAVVAPAALAVLLHPAAFEPAAFFEAIEERIEGSDVKADGSGGPSLDELADFVAVAGAGFEERENEQLGAALLPFEIGGCDVHIYQPHIS